MRNDVAAAALGAIALVWGGYTLRQARVSHGWPTVEGTIAHSGLVYATAADRRRPDSQRERLADVEYRYSVDGKAYVGHTISFSDDSLLYLLWDRIYEERTAARYANGETVTVHYDPDDPALAVLEVSSGRESLLFLAGGIAALAYAARAALR